MHDKDISHRDLNGCNVMVNEGLNGEIIIMIIDFGFSSAIDKSQYSNVGTDYYKPPEVDKNTKWGHKQDIYSIGRLLKKMLKV